MEMLSHAVWFGGIGLAVGLLIGLLLRRTESMTPAPAVAGFGRAVVQAFADMPVGTEHDDIDLPQDDWRVRLAPRLAERPTVTVSAAAPHGGIRPEWVTLNSNSDPDPVSDEDRRVEHDDTDYPYGHVRGNAASAIWTRLDAGRASVVRRFTRAFRNDRHEGWEHGHMHELRGGHASDVEAIDVGHQPLHAEDGGTRDLAGYKVAAS